MFDRRVDARSLTVNFAAELGSVSLPAVFLFATLHLKT